MSIFLFILGLILGFSAKFGIDQYHFYINNQEKTALKMEEILINFKAIEKAKELEKN